MSTTGKASQDDAQSRPSPERDSRATIINSVTTPLGFFVLVVLVVEALLGTKAFFSNGNDSGLIIVGMLTVIVLLILIVAGTAIYRPEALSGGRPVESAEQIFPTPPVVIAPKSILTDGSILNKGDKVVSNNGLFQLLLQATDGNLVLYDLRVGPPPTKALWESKTPDRGAERCILTEGNLVLYDSKGTAIWSSKSHGKNNPYLNVQDDGNVVIYEPSPIWSTNGLSV